MKPAAFEYHLPERVDEAARLLAELGDGAKLLAGGQSLIPMLSMRLAMFEHLVDVGRIPEMRGIEAGNGAVWIGAGTRQAEIGASAEIASSVPLLARATPLIGHFQIRNRGTIGGSLAHADPAAEYPTVAVLLDAEFEARSSRGRRTIAASEFFAGVWSTALDDDEILVGLRVPRWDGRCGFAIEELARRHGDFAIAGAAVGVELDSSDRVARCAVGLFGMDSTPCRATAMENAARGTAIGDCDPDELGRMATAELDSVPSDLHGSADYRRRVGAVMVARAWRAAAEEASNV